MHPFLSLPRPHLFGHRGASGEAPENTRVAFERALAQGVQYLEMDCHATRDGEIVILHDPHVDRVTNATGSVKEYRFAELCELDAGFRFSLDGLRFPYRGQGVRIPKLGEVLEAFPEANINLEIKQADPPITEEVVRIIERAQATSRVLLAAEQDAVMADIRRLDPGTAFGFSRGDVLAFFKALHEGDIERFEPPGQALQIPAGFADRPLVTSESVAAAHRLGLCMHVWTINEPDEMRRLLVLQVDGLMSDFPARLVEVTQAQSDGR